ncbi:MULTISPECIES: DUF4114 domain-containing protein [unclassified Lentimonas]|uniref:DUF4114 domain-containing protein n=1 Tax=unclassified Lentimonas TaxID=2630993 RepID=UPI00132B7CFB|nr:MULTISPECIES: DUF4114 domain-containing protein [unclassified Lentimonas]CAA6678264.1 Unannotated [Lentimonas sp. CC4]CAA6684840.1 Unannotated [Lentimonas sp. CC6]CAA7076805.1 Unannotated [Lentimonas sp. CC4]CAA7170797.1 Unannotated [Lentimonas sp. CC21]CAA7179641.1 Unannotated [Lentimonas sp. CC8]
MKNILKLILATSLIQQISFAQTEADFQDSARPFGIDIIDSVMAAGSDEASASFQSEDLPVLLDFVNANLSEYQSLSDIAAVSLDPESLYLHNDSAVRVYFLAEGAGYRNTLGFTTQDIATGDTSSASLIFPDASSSATFMDESFLTNSDALENANRTNNTPLVSGDFVDLGVYDTGTFVDFFLISNGANGGSNTYTSDASTNPDLIQHVVAFAIPDSPFLLIGFEDLYNGGDRDFNDIVFAVDIGSLNVAYLANPEPAVWSMMAVLCLAGFVMHRRRSGEILSSIC